MPETPTDPKERLSEAGHRKLAATGRASVLRSIRLGNDVPHAASQIAGLLMPITAPYLQQPRNPPMANGLHVSLVRGILPQEILFSETLDHEKRHQRPIHREVQD